MRFKPYYMTAALILVTACSGGAQTDITQISETPSQEQNPSTKAETAKMDHSKIVTGNGEHNFITLEGASRDGNSLTFPEVVISKPGFLVLHPFKNGKPVPTEYVGAVPIKAGQNTNVAIEVDGGVSSGDMFVVMLHYDMNEDEIFDFNDGITVPDAPVFEGHKLIALRYRAP